MKKILFVCLGNICRSSTAEGVMLHLIKEAGLEEALKLWVEIRQVDRKKGWERLEAEIGR